MSGNRTEHGQVLVLILLAVVALMGFAALAVDGGHLLSERRRAQNAADAAAYAAAMAASLGNDWELAALNQAEVNAYADADPGVNAGTPLDVQVYHPPLNGPYVGDDEYYQVVIRSGVQGTFSHFIYRGLLGLTVEAVSRAQPVQGISSGNALHATTPDECKAITFHGNSEIDIIGGNVYSNSDAEGQPASCHSVRQDGNGDLTVTGGGVVAVGSIDLNNQSSADFILDFSEPQPIPNFPEPDCSHLEDRSYGGGDATLEPGIYGEIRISGAGTDVTLSDGMYCLDGDFTITGGDVTGRNILIVMRQGGIRFSGNGTIRMFRANHLLDGSDNEWGGMLIYMPEENDNEVYMSGGSGTNYAGTIFAPGPRSPASQDKCIIEGNSDSIGVSASMICYSIKIGGTADVKIVYDEEKNFRLPPMLELAE